MPRIRFVLSNISGYIAYLRVDCVLVDRLCITALSN